MSGPFLELRLVGQPQIEAKLKGLNDALDTRKILDEGAAVIYNRMRDRFLREVDPTGQPWVPSRSALYRKSHGIIGGTLFRTGRLFRSILLFAPDDHTRAIGTDARSDGGFFYPLVHQQGLGGFPERQFLGFGDDDTQTMVDVVIRRVLEGLAK